MTAPLYFASFCDGNDDERWIFLADDDQKKVCVLADDGEKEIPVSGWDEDLVAALRRGDSLDLWIRWDRELISVYKEKGKTFLEFPNRDSDGTPFIYEGGDPAPGDFVRLHLMRL